MSWATIRPFAGPTENGCARARLFLWKPAHPTLRALDHCMRSLPSDIAMQRVRRKKVSGPNRTKNFPFSLFLSDGAAHRPLLLPIGCATIFWSILTSPDLSNLQNNNRRSRQAA